MRDVWKGGDVMTLPVFPDGVIYRHVNTGTAPARCNQALGPVAEGAQYGLYIQLARLLTRAKPRLERV